MKDNHLMSIIAEVFKGVHNRVGIVLVEVRDQDNQSSFGEAFGDLVDGLPHVREFIGLDPFKRQQNRVEMGGRTSGG